MSFFQENSLGIFSSVAIVAYLSLLIALFRVINFLGPHGPTLDLSFTLTAFCSFFARYFVFVLLRLLHREYYGFERAFISLRHFLPCIPSSHLVHAPPQPAFIKGSVGVSTSSLKVAGCPTVAWNTDSAHLFVWITQCLANLRKVKSSI